MRNYLRLLFPLAESHGAIQRLTATGDLLRVLEDRKGRLYDFFNL